MTDALRAELAKVNAAIDALYWAFTRQARAKPPVVVRPDLYRRRAEIEGALERIRFMNRSKPPRGSNPCSRCGLPPISMSQRTPFRQTFVWCPTCTRKPYAADTMEAAVNVWNAAHTSKVTAAKDESEDDHAARWACEEYFVGTDDHPRACEGRNEHNGPHYAFCKVLGRIVHAKPTDLALATGNQDLRQPSSRVHVTPTKESIMTAATNVISARTVPLSALWLEAPNWINPREFSGLDTEDIEELGESLKTKGIVEPLKVQRILMNGDTVDLVVDGQRRVLAARTSLAKNAPIPVVDIEEDVIELTPEAADRLLEKAFATLERKGLSSFELASAARRWKAREKTGAYIASQIGKSESWVSKILKALDTATPKLVHSWKKGEITDEQFKELAEVKDPEEQKKAAKEVVDTRKSGDKAEARVRAKEITATARVTNGHSKGKPAPLPPREQLPLIKGEGEPAPSKPADVAPVKPAGPKPPSKAAIEDLLGMADKRPPTSDYVKGLLDGVRYMTGALQPDQFAKAWTQYVNRIDGHTKPKGSLQRTADRQAATRKRLDAATARAKKGKSYSATQKNARAVRKALGKKKGKR